MSKQVPKQAWPDLDLLCLKAMRHEAHERYPSVEALLRDLNHYLRNEPLEARPDSWRYRAGKFVARNRSPIFATAAALLIVAGLTVFYTVRLDRAKNAALAEAARTKRIQHFTESLFTASITGAAPPADLRVSTLLERGAKEADSLRADPATQGELYANYGNLYDMLGDFPKASELLLLALDKERAALGPDDPQVVETLAQLAVVRTDQSQNKEAERYARQAIEIAGRRLPADDPRVVDAKSALGKVLLDSGDYRGAVAVLEPLVQRKPSARDDEYALSQNLSFLATAQYQLANIDAADALGQRELVLDLRLFGEHHPQVALAYWRLGMDRAANGEYPAAEAQYRRALDILKGWYGVDHPDTATLMDNLAEVLDLQGKDDEAQALVVQALKIQQHFYSPLDQRLAETVHTLGMLKLKRGDIAGAKPDLTRAVQIFRASLGDGSFATATITADLADVYIRQGQYAQAEQMLRGAVATLKATLPPDAANTATAQALLGRALLRLKRYSEAEQALSAADRVFRTYHNQSWPEVVNARRDLAEVYSDLHEPDKAKPYQVQVASYAADAASTSH